MSRHHETSWRQRLPRIADLAMTGLGLVFIVLLVMQYTADFSFVGERRLNLAIILIWAVFGIDFFVRLAFAPSKLGYLRHNWISAIALVLPAFRVLRVVQIARVAPSVQVSVLVSEGRREADWLRRNLGLHPASYIGVLTLFIAALSSAGMYSMEHDRPDANITNVGDGIWWTASTLTTIGSELYPVTGEGRVLAIFVMIYALGFAGYTAGVFTTLILGTMQAASANPSAPAKQPADNAALEHEIRALRQQIQTMVANGASPAATESTAGESTQDTQNAALYSPH